MRGQLTSGVWGGSRDPAGWGHADGQPRGLPSDFPPRPAPPCLHFASAHAPLTVSDRHRPVVSSWICCGSGYPGPPADGLAFARTHPRLDPSPGWRPGSRAGSRCLRVGCGLAWIVVEWKWLTSVESPSPPPRRDRMPAQGEAASPGTADLTPSSCQLVEVQMGRAQPRKIVCRAGIAALPRGRVSSGVVARRNFSVEGR
eukprot:gene12635-biopygen3450